MHAHSLFRPHSYSSRGVVQERWQNMCKILEGKITKPVSVSAPIAGLVRGCEAKVLQAANTSNHQNTAGILILYTQSNHSSFIKSWLTGLQEQYYASEG